MRALTCIIVACLAALAVASATAADFDFTLHLKGRQFTPIRVTTSVVKSTGLIGQHIYMQFEHPLTESDKRQLEKDGIELLDYLPNLAYMVNLNIELDADLMERHGIRWFDRIDAADKIAPDLGQSGVAQWAKRGDGKAQFAVVIQADEDLEFWGAKLEADYGAEIIGLAFGSRVVDLVMAVDGYLELALLDGVQWIEQAPPPQEETNDDCRANTGAAVLQEMPYDLQGQMVSIAEWDGGGADGNHSDLHGRVFSGDGAALANHATHVAGTVLGDGSASGGNLRGMAPAATLVSYLWWNSASEMEAEYAQAMLDRGVVISTNSWSLGVGNPATESACQSLMGKYHVSCGALDNVVRGSAFNPISICWSAGNQRGSSSQYCGSLGWTYNTVPPYATAKNIITVGAINSNNNSMTSFSSWGPCDDGRIKPDVVGPGCQQGGDGGVTSCRVGSGYTVMCGTSMSCPSVAGTIALIIQGYRQSGGAWEPRASTIKGVLVNTANDLGSPGPDYQYGHGGVDGVAAVEKIVMGTPSLVEAQISTGETHIYDLTVPGTEKLKVTIVWDDPGGTSSSSKDLINDLDLALIDPFENPELPWVLDPNQPSHAATKGADHTNNVETVEVDNPYAGLWKARVSGFDVPTGPQKYTIVFSPDSVHAPGQSRAVAVFPQGDLVDDPGQQVTAEFWVSNVGLDPDSIQVQINDNAGWLLAGLDTVVILNSYDSVYFSVEAVIPGGSIAGDLDSIACQATSLSNTAITTVGQVIVEAGAYYAISLAALPDDTVASPDTYQFTVNISNSGNDTDVVYVTPEDLMGWTFSPTVDVVSVPPFSNGVASFDLTVPYEIEHLTSDPINLYASSDGGVGDTVSFTLIVNNPYLPPALIEPAQNSYSQQRQTTFVWEGGEADDYTLVVSEDAQLNTILYSYSGIVDTSFTLPAADSLNDGEFWWGVRRHVGVDSSSLQGTAFGFTVDNIAPPALAPLVPTGDGYVANKQFLIFYQAGKADRSSTAPEYAIARIASDSLITSDVHIYDDILSNGYLIEDTLTEGRWWWDIQPADSAGNVGPISPPASFILDTESPAVPVQDSPPDGQTVQGSTVDLSWTAAPPPEYPAAPEFFALQISSSSQFLTMAYAANVWADSVSVASGYFSDGTQYWWRVQARDSAGHFSTFQASPFSFHYFEFVCGDIDGAGNGTDVADLTFLVNYLFGGGDEPDPPVAGSVDCIPGTDVADVTYLVDYLFGGGPPPCCD